VKKALQAPWRCVVEEGESDGDGGRGGGRACDDEQLPHFVSTYKKILSSPWPLRTPLPPSCCCQISATTLDAVQFVSASGLFVAFVLYFLGVTSFR
jgi:hypothetical protein